MTGGCQTDTPAATPRGFNVVEFTDRLDRARQLMVTQGVDALLLTTEADVRYFSGFLTPFWQSPTRPWFLLVTLAANPIAVIPAIGESCMRRTWLTDIRTWPSPQPADEGLSLLSATIHEQLGARAVIGIAMGPGSWLRMPLNDFQRLRAALPAVRWQDATPLLQRLRWRKSAAEVDRIRQACTVAGTAFAELPERIRPGMTDRDVFRIFRISCLQAGADEVPYLVGAAAAGGYEDIISPPAGRSLQSGDLLMLDTGCVYDGYFCDFDRNLAIGEASPAARQAYRVAWDATEAALAAARPGLRCDELFAVMHDVMAPYAVSGGSSVGRLGHGLGMELTEPPSLMPGDHTVLEEQMVMTLEAGFTYAAGQAMVHEEDVLITGSGCELLTVRAAAELPVVPWGA